MKKMVRSSEWPVSHLGRVPRKHGSSHKHSFSQINLHKIISQHPTSIQKVSNRLNHRFLLNRNPNKANIIQKQISMPNIALSRFQGSHLKVKRNQKSSPILLLNLRNSEVDKKFDSKKICEIASKQKVKFQSLKSYNDLLRLKQKNQIFSRKRINEHIKRGRQLKIYLRKNPKQPIFPYIKKEVAQTSNQRYIAKESAEKVTLIDTQVFTPQNFVSQTNKKENNLMVDDEFEKNRWTISLNNEQLENSQEYK